MPTSTMRAVSVTTTTNPAAIQSTRSQNWRFTGRAGRCVETSSSRDAARIPSAGPQVAIPSGYEASSAAGRAERSRFETAKAANE
jgi:hypothetical protein